MAITDPLASGWEHIFKDRRALEETQDKFEYYHRLALERAKKESDELDALAAPSMQTRYVLGAFGAQAQTQKAQLVPAIDLNTNPAYACTLAVAVDLWCAKYGDMWVSLEAVEDTTGDDYALYKVLAERLRNAHRMEYMPQMQSYRIILL